MAITKKNEKNLTLSHQTGVGLKKDSVFDRIVTDFRINKYLIFLAIPVVLWYLIFCYIPMYGIIIAFKDFNPVKGVFGSAWVGFRHFKEFFNSYYAWRVIRNTLLLNIYGLIFSFPAPIILAVLLNELRSKWFKKTVQTVTYLPHFVSMVVICGMITDFTSQSGIINTIIEMFGGERVSFLLYPEYFRTIYVASGVWQGVGWGSILYLAALTGIDQELYAAASIDGAGRWRQFLSVTLPGITPTISIMLILNIGNMMNVGYEKVILLYNPNTYETADIISSYVYRRGLINADYSFSVAVGLFNSLVNLVMIIIANQTSKKVNETSLW